MEQSPNKQKRSNASQKNLQDPCPVEIHPRDSLMFIYATQKISATLKIVVKPDYQKRRYCYSIKSTRKNDYKVSQPQGLLKKETVITIYIKKDIAPITRILHDKFQIIVTEYKSKQIVFKEQLGVAIESGIETNDQHRGQHGSANVSRLASVYFNSMDKMSSMQSSLYSGDRIRENLETILEKSEQEYKKPQLSLKHKLNNSIQEIESKKRRIQMLDRQISDQRAQGRFNLYLLVLVVILCFFLGLYFKNADLFRKIIIVCGRLARYLQRNLNRILTPT